MALRRIQFDDIAPGSSCLSDASTIADLAGQLATLSTPLDDRHANWILRNPDEFGLRAPLLALERWVVTDDLVADAIAIDSIQQGNALRTFNWQPSLWASLSPMRIALEREGALLAHIDTHLLQADSETSSALRAIQEVCAQLDIAFTFIPFEVVEIISRFVDQTAATIRQTVPDAPWDSYGFGIDKRYAEVLDHIYGSAAAFARSNWGVERTLFYYEVAASAQLPLVLHPRRRAEALTIARTCDDAYRAVKTTLATTFEEPLRDALSGRALPWDLPIPPLARLIVRTAGQQRDSLLSVAKQMKASNLVLHSLSSIMRRARGRASEGSGASLRE